MRLARTDRWDDELAFSFSARSNPAIQGIWRSPIWLETTGRSLAEFSKLPLFNLLKGEKMSPQKALNMLVISLGILILLLVAAIGVLFSNIPIDESGIVFDFLQVMIWISIVFSGFSIVYTAMES